MKKGVFQRKLRKTHRWFGVILGVQFLLWTIGGLYFSWSDMDEIHGDHQKAHIHPMDGNLKLANPAEIIEKIKAKDTVNFVFELKLIQILSNPIYQITYSKIHDRDKKVQLANAETGDLRPALSKKEAIEIARNSFSANAKLKKVEYLTSTNGQHEYREQPLPAFAVSFDHPTNSTVYISSELGTVQKFRNDKWRIFDFLWMMHTMDYQTRDNFSNWLLRGFSIFGIFTILTGFTLFFVSRKTNKN